VLADCGPAANAAGPTLDCASSEASPASWRCANRMRGPAFSFRGASGGYTFENTSHGSSRSPTAVRFITRPQGLIVARAIRAAIRDLADIATTEARLINGSAAPGRASPREDAGRCRVDKTRSAVTTRKKFTHLAVAAAVAAVSPMSASASRPSREAHAGLHPAVPRGLLPALQARDLEREDIRENLACCASGNVARCLRKAPPLSTASDLPDILAFEVSCLKKAGNSPRGTAG